MFHRFPNDGGGSVLPRASSTPSMMPPRRRVDWAILSLSIIAVFFGTVMPQAAVAWLRVHVPFFALIWDSLDALLPWFNPLHIILYAWVAALWRALTPRWSRWWIVLLGGAFAAISESLQLLAPGRTARISDVLNDLIGIAIGLILVALIRRAWPTHRAARN